MAWHNKIITKVHTANKSLRLIKGTCGNMPQLTTTHIQATVLLFRQFLLEIPNHLLCSYLLTLFDLFNWLYHSWDLFQGTNYKRVVPFQIVPVPLGTVLKFWNMSVIVHTVLSICLYTCWISLLKLYCTTYARHTRLYHKTFIFYFIISHRSITYSMENIPRGGVQVLRLFEIFFTITSLALVSSIL